MKYLRGDVVKCRLDTGLTFQGSVLRRSRIGYDYIVSAPHYPSGVHVDIPEMSLVYRAPLPYQRVDAGPTWGVPTPGGKR